MTTTDQVADETVREIADMVTESAPQIDGDEEAGIIETGEKSRVKGHEVAVRTLLTHGPVAEEKIAVGNLQGDLTLGS